MRFQFATVFRATIYQDADDPYVVVGKERQ